MLKRAVTILGTPAAILGLATLLVYALIAPAWIVEGDNAEFAGLAALGGAAHPSGYPLYVLWLRAWSWLPAHSPAHAAALATCLLTAIEAVLLWLAARAWGAKSAGATLAAALVVASPVVVRVQSQAEVFAMNGVVAAAVLWLAAAAGPVRGDRRVVLLGLVAGLGLSNHLTCAFIAPIGILGVVRGVRESERPRLAVAKGVAALLVGLAPYVYLLIAPSTQVSWGKLSSVTAVVRHILRMDYGGPGNLAEHGVQGVTVDNVVALARTLGRAFLWLPIAAALFAYKPRTETRGAWLCWLASFAIAGPLFVVRFNLAPEALEAYTVSRFHLLPMILLAVPIAVGASWLLERVHGRLLVGVGVVALAAGSLAVSIADVARFHTAAVERSLENTLETLPPNAIVIGTQDILHFGGNYLQAARGIRPDVTVVIMPQLPLGYYRERIRAKTGVKIAKIATEKDVLPSVAVAELMLGTGRPVFIDQFQANIAKAFPVYPYGLVFRVLPKGSAVPTIEELFTLNKDLYAKFRFDYAIPGPNDDLAAQAHAQYAATWRALAQALTDPEHRAYAEGMMRALMPQ